MMVSRTGKECKISVEGEEVEEVEKLKYLGVTISGAGGCDDETEQRIGAAARVVGAMRKEVWERRELQKETKMRVYNAMGCPLYSMGVRHGQYRGGMKLSCKRLR